MPELIAARVPPRFGAAPVLESLPVAARFVLRGGNEVRLAAETAAGVAIPAQACRAAVQGERAALWLGPDEWLLVAPTAEGAELGGSLELALARQAACVLDGPQAATLLSAGCPLDLDESAFPIGMCTRTVLAKAEVVLWRTAAQTFRLEVARSFVAYVSLFLAEAARASALE